MLLSDHVASRADCNNATRVIGIMCLHLSLKEDRDAVQIIKQTKTRIYKLKCF